MLNNRMAVDISILSSQLSSQLTLIRRVDIVTHSLEPSNILRSSRMIQRLATRLSDTRSCPTPFVQEQSHQDCWVPPLAAAWDTSLFSGLPGRGFTHS